jgi:hypothetical protein
MISLGALGLDSETWESRLLGCCRSLAGLGVLAPEPLNASRRVNQPLLAGKERVANRADFHMDVALVGRTRFKIASAGANHLHRGVIGMNLFLGHLVNSKTFPAIHLF